MVSSQGTEKGSKMAVRLTEVGKVQLQLIFYIKPSSLVSPNLEE